MDATIQITWNILATEMTINNMEVLDVFNKRLGPELEAKSNYVLLF